ncbi:hypothetical protein ES705_15588 [subsurface metagenome]
MDEKLKIENERIQFKNLIASNPNYFGSIKDKATVAKFPPVKLMKNNTTYEELLCVGFYPEYNLLEAVIEMKLPYGFHGPLCSIGSKEYVAFYIDYNDGAGFVSTGAPAEVHVHDLSFVNGGHVFYAVRKAFIPKEYWKCGKPQIVKVRAILSWEAIPTSFNYDPVWGNVIDVWVQIQPKQLPIIIYPPIPFEKHLIMGDLKEIKEFVDKSIKLEYDVKEKDKIEKQRLEFKELISKNPNYFGSIIDSENKAEIKKAINQLPKEIIKKLIDITDLLVPAEIFLSKTRYEELKCVGLYPNDDLLEAIIEVKLPYGFSGDLCTMGSKEYVAFYIDWGSGYQHVGTSIVSVHDIPFVNDKHLFYAVKARVKDVESKLKACTDENIVKVKAILSWNQNPTPYGRNFTPTWGNVIIRNIQIRPKDGESVKCNISIVNEVHMDNISQIGANIGLALKIDAGGNAVPWIYDRPFGGIIACWGYINVPATRYYRFRYSDDGGITWNNIRDSRIAYNPLPWSSTIGRIPDSEGWFRKEDFDNDKDNYDLTALVHWKSYGKLGNHLLRLELADVNKNIITGQSYDIFLKLDNTNPELFTFGGTPAPLPAKGVTVKDSSGIYKKCEKFKGSEEIKIYGNFRDNYFKNFRLKVFGGNIDVSGVKISSVRYDSGSPGIDDEGVIGAMDGGLGQEIASLDLCTIPQSPNKIKCAYGVELVIWDRSIVGRIRGYEFNTYSHTIDGFVTFDWNPAGC